MDYGAKYIRWAPFAEADPEPAGKLPNYGEPVTLGALNKLSENITFNEAKGYGDNALKVHVIKFKEAALAIETTEVPRASMSQLVGAVIDKDKNMWNRDNDKTPYGGLGFYINKILDDGSDVCVGIFYFKAKAMLQGNDYTTNGENITLANSKLQLTVAASNVGYWRVESDYFATEEEAQSWVDDAFKSDFDIESLIPISASLPGAMKLPTSTSGKAEKI